MSARSFFEEFSPDWEEVQQGRREAYDRAVVEQICKALQLGKPPDRQQTCREWCEEAQFACILTTAPFGDRVTAANILAATLRFDDSILHRTLRKQFAAGEPGGLVFSLPHFDRFATLHTYASAGCPGGRVMFWSETEQVRFVLEPLAQFLRTLRNDGWVEP